MTPMLKDYEKVMKAAADPTRARILKMLEGGEMCVCQVIAVLGLSQSTVSKHLSLLKGAGLVRERRERKFVHYSLAGNPPSETARTFLGNLRGWMARDPMVVRDRERAALARELVASMATVSKRLGSSHKGVKR
jgi:ArsR family transcriptional regulator, arsenate/arsenite/antimonite-responsive transcriptional repressor